ncbi:hypothetical protein MM221_05105 [Salipaludibacillus sp. LMS25]|jgi:hypothetical protein|uniref:hypothetical protein n=1 Tax=Salipaludibacillus sp. LMS25 TaxID=2924031 RepID=UPI0020D01749|nr:hypothetical protein [Salipaludibacillus sp. LMS25]UTR15940.1 hypothetical protein MM221_05105 [Salipaludibacillus sp. LMS25]
MNFLEYEEGNDEKQMKSKKLSTGGDKISQLIGSNFRRGGYIIRNDDEKKYSLHVIKSQQ